MRSGGSSLEKTWRAVLDHLADHVDAGDLADLIRPLRPLSLTPSELRLEAPNRLILACVTDRFLPQLRAAVVAVAGPRQLALEVSARQQGELFPDLARPRPARRALAAQAQLHLRHTFDTFVVGASNQFAHAASRAVAHQPGNHYNPLFVYGGVGLGKTHLVTAIGHEVLRRMPTAHVVFVPCDRFMNELISSLRRDRMAEFKQRFRGVDVLILDDVQLLAGRERTQEEFFHTFNALHEQHRQIVLTSDKVPKDIPDLEERLRNRFEWGLIADIQPPDVETRVAILQRKAELDGIRLPPPVALLLAQHITTNVRELEGSLTRLGAHASLRGQPLTVDYAREVLHDLLGATSPMVSFERITQQVCEHFGVRPADLHSRRRSRHVTEPRHVAMYLCRQLLHASLTHLGELFQRDHSSVHHGVKSIERRLKQDVALQTLVDRLAEGIRRQQSA